MNLKEWEDAASHAATGLSYLDDVSTEYELDNPGYVRNLQEFKREKENELADIYNHLADIADQLDDYTSYVNKPNA